MATKEKSSDDKTEKSAGTSEITYIPQEGDKPITKIGGITFHANVPVQVLHTVTVDQLHTVPHVIGDHAGHRSVEKKVPLAEVLRGNPGFRVDGVQAPRKTATDRLPETPEQYRGYAMTWMADSTDLKSFNVRWDAEEALRAACGVDHSDAAYLKPFRDYKRGLLGGASAAA
jgi:hypothetical protein